VRLPRDLSGVQLAHALERYGYRVTRQTGSHLRLTLAEGEGHHLTIPAHANLRVGTLNSILRAVDSDWASRGKSSLRSPSTGRTRPNVPGEHAHPADLT
jgi:predicted RNA binding protein YcfA (HicA-like mRNA interferase family)